MKASQEIREALARVTQLRQVASGPGALPQALNAVKHLQAQRFSGTYADLLASPTFAPSATFFLEELYSAKDYSARDEQFSRIAAALEHTFPESVIATVLAVVAALLAGYVRLGRRHHGRGLRIAPNEARN